MIFTQVYIQKRKKIRRIADLNLEINNHLKSIGEKKQKHVFKTCDRKYVIKIIKY